VVGGCGCGVVVGVVGFSGEKREFGIYDLRFAICD
jgi:hypothetical protein